MSKGYGRVERAILVALSAKTGVFRKGADVVTLARYVATGDVTLTRSELESVRRALRNLCRQGLVEVTEQRHAIYRMLNSG